MRCEYDIFDKIKYFNSFSMDYSSFSPISRQMVTLMALMEFMGFWLKISVKSAERTQKQSVIIVNTSEQRYGVNSHNVNGFSISSVASSENV